MFCILVVVLRAYTFPFDQFLELSFLDNACWRGVVVSLMTLFIHQEPFWYPTFGHLFLGWRDWPRREISSLHSVLWLSFKTGLSPLRHLLSAVDTYEDLSHLLLYYITSCGKNLCTPHLPHPLTDLFSCRHHTKPCYILSVIYLNKSSVSFDPYNSKFVHHYEGGDNLQQCCCVISLRRKFLSSFPTVRMKYKRRFGMKKASDICISNQTIVNIKGTALNECTEGEI
jgi:hypothetical protein